MSCIKFINKNTVEIITTVLNTQPSIMFKDKSVGFKNVNTKLTKGDNCLICEPIDEGYNDLGQEVKVTLTLPNLKDNSNIINGFLFVNYNFEECFITEVNEESDIGFSINYYDDELKEQCNNYWNNDKSFAGFEISKLFMLVEHYSEYLDTRNKNIKKVVLE